MITDEQANELNESVMLLCKDASPSDKAMVGVMTAILNELRTLRKSTMQLQEQFDKVTAYGNAMLTEVAR